MNEVSERRDKGVGAIALIMLSLAHRRTVYLPSGEKNGIELNQNRRHGLCNAVGWSLFNRSLVAFSLTYLLSFLFVSFRYSKQGELISEFAGFSCSGLFARSFNSLTGSAVYGRWV